jgi:hypothetical protein
MLTNHRKRAYFADFINQYKSIFEGLVNIKYLIKYSAPKTNFRVI